MSEQKVPLPEFPKADTTAIDIDNNEIDVWDAESMRAYGDAREQAGWNAAIAWAAKKCDEREMENWDFYKQRRGGTYAEGLSDGAGECAAAIREGQK